MFDPNAPLPDFVSQQQGIERQKTLAALLRKQALQQEGPQGQMVGPHYIPPSWSQQLGTLADAGASAYMDRQVGEAEKAYGGAVEGARKAWEEGLPKITPAVPGRPELQGPPDEGGSPELAAIPRQAAQLPDRSTVLKATLAGMNIPGNAAAATLWNKGMGEEIVREDTQTEKAEQSRLRAEERLMELKDKLMVAREKLAMEERLGYDTNATKEYMAELLAEARKYGANMTVEAAKVRAEAAADKPPKPLPPKQSLAWLDNNSLLKQIDDAERDVDANPKAFGYKGVLPNIALQRIDPKGNEARIKVSKIGSMEIKNTSGTAVSGAEFERIKPWIPTLSDTPATIKMKLSNLRRIVKEYQTGILDFAETQDYKSPAKSADAAPKAAAAEKKVINGKTYVKKNGQWFEQ